MAVEILLVDDDPLLRRGLGYSLQRAGYRVHEAGDAIAGLKLARESRPDLVLLDIGLPGMDGLDALTVFQELQIPVILLTARRGEQDEVAGLELGALDYIKKPYDTDVLLARVASVLRRTSPREAIPTPTRCLSIGNLVLDPLAREARVGKRALDLTPRTFEVLHLLALNSPNVVPLDAILSQVWGANYVGEPQVLYVHIRWLREALAKAPESGVEVVTIHRVGYKLAPC